MSDIEKEGDVEMTPPKKKGNESVQIISLGDYCADSLKIVKK